MTVLYDFLQFFHNVHLYNTFTLRVLFTGKIPFFSIEHGKCAVTKSFISHESLHVTAIRLQI